MTGADILAQLGSGSPKYDEYQAEVCEILEGLLSDVDIAVLDAAIIGLGHRNADDILLSNLNFIHHPSEDIRFSMAVALGRIDHPKAIRALIQLSRDSDEDVRDWATFGLGTQNERNTKAIREALKARLDDPHDMTRLEAISGLCKRRIKDVLPYLEAELIKERVYNLAVESAGELGAPELLLVLNELIERIGDDDGRIEDAIAATKQNPNS